MHGGAFVYIGQERRCASVLSVVRSVPMRTTVFRVLALLLLAMPVSVPAEVGRIFNSNDFDRKLIALYKVVSFVYDRPEEMNVDSAFGITIAEANIAATLLHENSKQLNGRYSNILNKILKLCEGTRHRLKSTVVPENNNLYLVNEALNKPELWAREISWKRGTLGLKPIPTSGLNQEVVQNFIFHGIPQETESDNCLSKIIKSKLRGYCKIPTDCDKMLRKNDGARGYPLTHRLLLVQVARVLGCSDDYHLPFSVMATAYCRSILQDLVDIEATKFPNVSRDLVSEQVLLCGSEGFMEFTDKHYADLILSWAHSSGCYSAVGFPKNRRSKRMTLATDYGCDSHATGLAAATLALLVRQDVETDNFYFGTRLRSDDRNEQIGSNGNVS